MARSPKSHCQIGPLSGRSAHIAHFNPRVTFSEPARRITNAGSHRPLDLAHEWRGAAIRPGSMVAFSLPSRGQGC
jgi:hypothetical protein